MTNLTIEDLSIFQETALDLDLVEKGRWFDCGTINGSPISVLVASSESKTYKQLVRKYTEPFTAENRRGKDTEAFLQAFLMAAVDGLIRGWRGVKRGDEEVPYDKELARTIFTHRAMEPITTDIINFAKEIENFKLKNNKAAEKN